MSGLRLRGFTLVELIMVIALSGIVAVMIGSVLSRPLDGFVAQGRRSELTDLAATALNRMAREIRLAVPNSMREVGTLKRELEWLPIHEAGRYRANQTEPGGIRHDPPRCPASGACQIEVLSLETAAAARQQWALRAAESRWMIIYNLGAPLSAGSRTPLTATGGAFSLDETSGMLTLPAASAGHAFAYASPQHRFYLAREMLRYRCENPGTLANGDGSGRLWRETSNQIPFASASQALVVDSVSSCVFDYAAGTHLRSGLATLRLGVKLRHEEVVLMQQVHIDNAP